mmetsp:Transcript_7494/g.12604  ORF Transcript_7494/g.12604 Transcript_7494/m.12604 type:complete len:775 (+) Transcript_7494:136-2460(+)
MSSSAATIRLPTPADYIAIKELMKESYLALADHYGEIYRDMLIDMATKGDMSEDEFVNTFISSDENILWVLDSKNLGGVVGCVGLKRKNTEESELVRMAVAPELRGTGMGKKLIRTLINYAKQKQVCRIVLRTANPSAARFYGSNGFLTVDSGPFSQPVTGLPDFMGQFYFMVYYCGARLVRNVAIVGGTHGNERLGVELVKHWMQNAAELQRSTLKITTLLGNPPAIVANQRFIDVDLNRQFKQETIEEATRKTDAAAAAVGSVAVPAVPAVPVGTKRKAGQSVNEAAEKTKTQKGSQQQKPTDLDLDGDAFLPTTEAYCAARMNALLGPKTAGYAAPTGADFVLDLHSSTAKTGLMLIPGSLTRGEDSVANHLCAYLQQQQQYIIPNTVTTTTSSTTTSASNDDGEAAAAVGTNVDTTTTTASNPAAAAAAASTVRVCSTDLAKQEYYGLDSLAPSGLAIEVGPLAHGTMNYHLLEQTRQLVLRTLDCLEQRNTAMLDEARLTIANKSIDTAVASASEHDFAKTFDAATATYIPAVLAPDSIVPKEFADLHFYHMFCRLQFPRVTADGPVEDAATDGAAAAADSAAADSAAGDGDVDVEDVHVVDSGKIEEPPTKRRSLGGGISASSSSSSGSSAVGANARAINTARAPGTASSLTADNAAGDEGNNSLIMAAVQDKLGETLKELEEMPARKYILHNSLDFADWAPIRDGAPLFQAIDGSDKVIPFSRAIHANMSSEADRNTALYTVFINEAAYQQNNVACWIIKDKKTKLY